ncbi:MAG: hypothetical protein LUO82_06295 [Methanomicrobiales archaeon]|nr:hypothetical protein [Methanomicrobiales archaeon]
MTTLRFFYTYPIKAKKIKLVVSLRCELCGREHPLDELGIHTMIDEKVAQQQLPADLEGFLLVLCTWCHWDLHAFSVPISEQEELIRERPEMIRHQIRQILAYTPKPYTPPNTDMEQFFLEA